MASLAARTDADAPRVGPRSMIQERPMSLWTPGGEVPVGREREDAGSPEPGQGAGSMVGAPDLDSLSPEERAQAEAMIAQMAEVQRQILSAPAAQFVTNHVVGFYELAAIHLGQPEPDLEAAQLAIDAMSSVLDRVEDRLGEDGRALRDALTQIQMAFVQVSATADQGSAGSDAPS
jgi:hypothetical protein